MACENKTPALMFLLVLTGSAAALLGAEDKCLRGTIVMEGLVIAGSGSALPGTAPSPNSFVVKATRVLPPAEDAVVRIEKGESVTVFGASQPPVEGQRIRIYALGGSLGKNVALREVCREKLTITSAAASVNALDAIASKRGAVQIDDLRKQIERAELACFGRVTAVLPPLSAQPRLGNVSEHDPQWRIAVVDLSGCARNAASTPGFRLRFPGTDDISFSHLHKPSVGEEGFFLIRRIEAHCDRELEPEMCVNGELIGTLSAGKARAAGYDDSKKQP